MTNAEAIAHDLLNADDFTSVASHFACPYTDNLNCEYPLGYDELGCDECKAEWLEKEWEE